MGPPLHSHGSTCNAPPPEKTMINTRHSTPPPRGHPIPEACGPAPFGWQSGGQVIPKTSSVRKACPSRGPLGLHWPRAAPTWTGPRRTRCSAPAAAQARGCAGRGRHTLNVLHPRTHWRPRGGASDCRQVQLWRPVSLALATVGSCLHYPEGAGGWGLVGESWLRGGHPFSKKRQATPPYGVRSTKKRPNVHVHVRCVCSVPPLHMCGTLRSASAGLNFMFVKCLWQHPFLQYQTAVFPCFGV